MKLDRHDGEGFSMTEYTAPPGFAPPPVLHRHTRESAGAYILDGELSMWFEGDDEPRKLGPGTFVWLPRGAWFRWANETEEPVRWLNFFTPPGFDHFFAEVAAEVTAAGGPSPEVMARVVPEVRARYGDEGHPDA
ncbi:MAG: cupin domain-containing protein [Nitriliruptorales bacterium]|nr:cupin domain-containing protein [Nitriliruptorales bacterium]